MDREMQEVIGAVELQLKRVSYALESLVKLQVGQGTCICVCVACGCSLLSPIELVCPVCGTPCKAADA